MMRLFVSLSLPDDALAALSRVQDSLPAGRPVAEENLHLTLAFLGDQPQSAAEAIHDALSTLRADPVTLTLSGAALYGGRKGQAAGLEADGGPTLIQLHDRVKARIRGAGADFERRRFRPHVTVTRLRGEQDATRVLTALAAVNLGPFVCREVALMESRLFPDRAVYEALATYPLG